LCDSDGEAMPVSVDDRPTITKRSYVEPAFLTKMFEVQFLDDRPLSEDAEREVEAILEAQLDRHDVVIVADLGHGLLTDRLRGLL